MTVDDVPAGIFYASPSQLVVQLPRALLDEPSGSFVRYAHEPGDPHTVSSDSISAVCQDSRTGVLWILNFSGAVDKYDRYAPAFAGKRAGASGESRNSSPSCESVRPLPWCRV